jgi:hypothetical protein
MAGNTVVEHLTHDPLIMGLKSASGTKQDIMGNKKFDPAETDNL